MDRPQKLVLSNGSSALQSGVTTALVGVGFIVFGGLVFVLVQGGDLNDAVLPLGALGLFWLVWIVALLVITQIEYAITRRAINRLFAEGVWQQWQFPADEWQRLVDAEYQARCPEENKSAYSGVGCSTSVGVVFAAIVIAVGKIYINDAEKQSTIGNGDQVMTAIVFIAIAIVVVFAGAGLFQPLRQRYDARMYRRNAMRAREPRVWFGARGVYHEALGYTSLKMLEKVIDHTKSRREITFTVTMTAGGIEDVWSQPVAFPVPSGCEQEAAQLVLRYRQERLRD